MSLRRLIASPLLHFFVIGGLVFALYAVLDPAPEETARPGTIQLSPEAASGLAAQFASVWGRPPSPAELEALMQDWAAEEAMVREARALGLDRGDGVVRSRLRQKMLFLAEGPAAAQDPEEAELAAYYRENAARYAAPGKVSFRQLLLPPGAGPDEIAQLRRALDAGADPSGLGQGTLLPDDMEGMALPAVGRVFGERFAAELAALPAGLWSGPVDSGYGRHLVKIEAQSTSELPPLEAVRDRVLADWRAAEARRLRSEFSAAMLARYKVELPAAGEVQLP
ncbi:peptidyl-prolyl cis-trans isomerase [Mangrovicoccus sp. HB161399]|uniref:peptidylprolyl isomerase n=1 Tax=Mangrovicoccus sp. HB161399 TaxID=2720392 RepID=UPI001555A5C8|nr:peptidylprolyl isomerase [Mangrovicoccus sp. HB161399]